MAVSTLEYFKEKARQEKTEDFNFLKRFLYFFELVIPAQASESGNKINFLFPLVIPPESIMVSEPYTVEVTPTQNGGLYIEENGIVQRDISIKGNTGFKPRMLHTSSSFGSANTATSAVSGAVGSVVNDLGAAVGMAHTQPVESKSYSRSLPVNVLAAISGQRHFQYLQDAVFRTYADLKKDPATAAETKLKFHNPRDDEHWEVVPTKFSLEREKGRRFLYVYSIDLIAVGPAEAAELNYSEDKTVFDQFRDKISVAKKGLDIVNGSINDLTRLQDDLRTSIANINVIIDGANRIKSNVQDFVNGTTRLIETSHKTVMNLVDTVETSLVDAHILARANVTREVPETPTHMLRKLNTGLEFIGSSPELFITSVNTEAESVKASQNKSKIFTTEQINEAKNSDTPKTYAGVNALGSALTQGEAIAIEGEVTINSYVNTYTSSKKVSIQQGDTLLSLAARYMGDARLWQYIAIANGLEAPFVDDIASKDISKIGDESPFGSAFGIGDYINIPTNSASINSYPILPVLGTATDESIENQLLGVDFALDPIQKRLDETVTPFSNRVLYDIPIDYEKGALDAKLVEGLANIKQSIIMRVVTEKGSVLLFKNFGLSAIVGTGFTPTDLENSKYRIRESILSDPRLSSIGSLILKQDKDALSMEVDIGLRGFSEIKTVQALLG